MTKANNDPREQQQREEQQIQQDANNHRQRAESEEVAGRHKTDGQKSHEGADKGPAVSKHGRRLAPDRPQVS